MFSKHVGSCETSREALGIELHPTLTAKITQVEVKENTSGVGKGHAEWGVQGKGARRLRRLANGIRDT